MAIASDLLYITGPTGITDQSGNSNDATYNGGMGIVADTGESGVSAFLFTTDDYITTPTPLVANDTAFSLRYWFRTDAVAARYFLSSSYGADVGQRNSVEISFTDIKIRIGTTAYTTVHTGIVIDTWYSMVFTYDGSQAIAYLDGVASTPLAQTGTVGLNDLTFGSYFNHAIYFVEGRMDKIAVSTDVLDATFAAAFHAAGRTDYVPATGTAHPFHPLQRGSTHPLRYT
jgi:hypothetical protein